MPKKQERCTVPHSFPCDAKKLLELIKDFYGSRWEAPPCVKKVPSMFGRRTRIFMDGQPLEDGELEMRHEAAKQIFMRLVDEVYQGMSPDIVLCGIDSFRWDHIMKIVLFGKRNGVSRGDWFAALRK